MANRNIIELNHKNGVNETSNKSALTHILHITHLTNDVQMDIVQIENRDNFYSCICKESNHETFVSLPRHRIFNLPVYFFFVVGFVFMVQPVSSIFLCSKHIHTHSHSHALAHTHFSQEYSSDALLLHAFIR